MDAECLVCGKIYKKNAHNQLYCSVKCKTKSYYKNNKKVVNDRCKAFVHSDIEKNRARHVAYYNEHKDAVKNRRLKRVYGISLEELRERLKNNGGKCEICRVEILENSPGRGVDSNAVVIDHNHDTGNVRGLLCSHCNLAIGLLKDNVITVARMLQYLQGSARLTYGDAPYEENIAAALNVAMV